MIRASHLYTWCLDVRDGDPPYRAPGAGRDARSRSPNSRGVDEVAPRAAGDTSRQSCQDRGNLPLAARRSVTGSSTAAAVRLDRRSGRDFVSS